MPTDRSLRHRRPRYAWRARGRRLRAAAPTGCAVVTARIIVGDPRRVGHLGVLGDVLGFARTVAAGALLVAIISVAVISMKRYAEARRATAAPRPRWQYLLLSTALAGAAVPALTYAAEFGNTNSLAVNFCAAVGIWSGLAALFALGRALFRVRRSAAPAVGGR